MVVVGAGGAVLTWLPALISGLEPGVVRMVAIAIAAGAAVSAQFLAFHEVRDERDDLKMDLIDIDAPVYPEVILETTPALPDGTPSQRFTMVRLQRLTATNRSTDRHANLVFTLVVRDAEGEFEITDEPYFTQCWRPRPDRHGEYLPNPTDLQPGATRKGHLGFLIPKSRRTIDPQAAGITFELRVLDRQTGINRSYPINTGV